MLVEFLKKFNFDFIFKSSTENYKKGIFNHSIKRVLEKYDDIMNIILPTLRSERRKTYSPFLPICPDTGKVLEIPVIEMDKKNNNVVFDNNGKKMKVDILNGKCKLQWKVDWAMRWFMFDVDFEMYEKDLIESAILSNKIVKPWQTTPNGSAYELFLDEKEKISKSKGNDNHRAMVTICITRKFIPLYVPKSKESKKLYPDVVPKAVDEYLNLVEKYDKQKSNEQLLNQFGIYTEVLLRKKKLLCHFLCY